MKGAIKSTHYFGRSFIMRQSNNYYLAWQTANKVINFNDVVFITREQYTTIKNLLGEVYREIKTDYAWIRKHRNPSNTYYKIKKYIMEEKLWP